MYTYNHIPGAARVYPRICPVSIPAAGGALRVSGLISFSPWITGEPAAGGMAFLRLSPGWFPSFRSVLPSRPVGPIPRTGRLLLRLQAPQGRELFPAPASGLAAEKRRRRKNPPPCILSAFDPVIDISVLDHRVSSVTGDDDVIENQDPDSVQQALELNCRGDILRRRGAGSARVVVAQQDTVGVIVQGGFHDQPGISGNFRKAAGCNPPASENVALGIERNHIEVFDPFTAQEADAVVFRFPAVADPVRNLLAKPSPCPDHGNHQPDEGSGPGTDSLDHLDLFRSGFQYALQASEGVQQALRQIGGFLSAGIGEQKLENLVIAEGAQILVCLLALAEPVDGGGLFVDESELLVSGHGVLLSFRAVRVLRVGARALLSDIIIHQIDILVNQKYI